MVRVIGIQGDEDGGKRMNLHHFGFTRQAKLSTTNKYVFPAEHDSVEKAYVLVVGIPCLSQYLLLEFILLLVGLMRVFLPLLVRPGFANLLPLGRGRRGVGHSHKLRGGTPLIFHCLHSPKNFHGIISSQKIRCIAPIVTSEFDRTSGRRAVVIGSSGPDVRPFHPRVGIMSHYGRTDGRAGCSRVCGNVLVTRSVASGSAQVDEGR